MQVTFIELIREEKKNGKSILMSSHLFNEVEGTCDRVGMIKVGKLIATVNPKDIRRSEMKTFKIEFILHEDFQTMLKDSFSIIKYYEGGEALLKQFQNS